MPESPFIFGVDLDGVCADYTAALRPIAAEWLGVPVESLAPDPGYDFPEWNLGTLVDVHRFAVTQRRLFETMAPIPGAAPALRRLSEAGVHIRIVTKRLIIPNFHETAVAQTIRWLDHHGIPYKDLCFLSLKQHLGCHIYIDDSPDNVLRLREAGMETIVFRSSQNRAVGGLVAESWHEVENLVMAAKQRWDSPI